MGDLPAVGTFVSLALRILGRCRRWWAHDVWCTACGERQNAVLPTCEILSFGFSHHILYLCVLQFSLKSALALQCPPELWLCLPSAQPQPCLCLAMGPVDLNWDPWTDFLVCTLDLTCHHGPFPETTGFCLALATPQDLIRLPSSTLDLPHHLQIASSSPFWTWPPTLALAFLEDHGTCQLPGETLPFQQCHHPHLLAPCAWGPEPCSFLIQCWLLLIIKFPLCGCNYLERWCITPSWNLLVTLQCIFCYVVGFEPREIGKRHRTGVDKSQLCVLASWSTIVPFIGSNICNYCSFLSQQELLLFCFYTLSLNWHVEVHESFQWPLRKCRCLSSVPWVRQVWVWALCVTTHCTFETSHKVDRQILKIYFLFISFQSICFCAQKPPTVLKCWLKTWHKCVGLQWRLLSFCTLRGCLQHEEIRLQMSEFLWVLMAEETRC